MNILKKIVLMMLLIPSVAGAFCSAPSAPFGGAPSKPSAPYCVNEWNNTHTCDAWEIESYNNALENYKTELEDFVSDLKDYLRGAQDYVNCEIRNLN